MSKTEKTDQAAPADTQGRPDAFKAQMDAFKAQLQDNTQRIEAMEARWGELRVTAPAVKQQPLAKSAIEAILAQRPSASFRLLQDVSFAGFNRTEGAIVRPQTLLPNIWAALLNMQVRMADADETA